MYHQFTQLANLDITTTPMEVGPTTHYIMGGVRVDSDTQESTVRGLFAAGECAAGINGANRLGGNSLSDLIVFGKRAGEYAAQFALQNLPGKINTDEVEKKAKDALAPFERNGGENPYEIQTDLQNLMQGNVGIVRNHDEMIEALNALDIVRNRAANTYVPGNVDFNPGWHTALDLKNLLIVSEAITRAALERKESRGGQYREDFPNKDPEYAEFNFSLKKTADGAMEIARVPIPEMPAELKQIIEEMG
jgi:succinate dehydrogenase / fumarate reductase flavoprotein subunit